MSRCTYDSNLHSLYHGFQPIFTKLKYTDIRTTTNIQDVSSYRIILQDNTPKSAQLHVTQCVSLESHVLN
jgi:hypothetical protein